MGSSCRTCGKHKRSIQATLHLRFISLTRGWLWRQTHLHLLMILMELKDADSSNFCPSSKSDWPKKRVKKHEGNCQSYDTNCIKSVNHRQNFVVCFPASSPLADSCLNVLFVLHLIQELKNDLPLAISGSSICYSAKGHR